MGVTKYLSETTRGEVDPNHQACWTLERFSARLSQWAYEVYDQIECIADEYGVVHGRSEREWSLILDEWREQQRQHGKNRITVNGPPLAKFLEEMMAEEELLIQRQRDLEAQLSMGSCGNKSLYHAAHYPLWALCVRYYTPAASTRL